MVRLNQEYHNDDSVVLRHDELAKIPCGQLAIVVKSTWLSSASYRQAAHSICVFTRLTRLEIDAYLGLQRCWTWVSFALQSRRDARADDSFPASDEEYTVGR